MSKILVWFGVCAFLVPARVLGQTEANVVSTTSRRTILLSSPSAAHVAFPGRRAYARRQLDALVNRPFVSWNARELILSWKDQGVLRWNEYARELVARNAVNPPMASRMYAALSVAQYDALVAARYERGRFESRNAASLDVTGMYAHDQAVLASVSVRVLKGFFPAATEEIEARGKEQLTCLVQSQAVNPLDVYAGQQIGRTVAEKVLTFIASDGFDAKWTGTIPEGLQYWRSLQVPPAPPLLPLWGKVRPWLMDRVENYRAPPPPAMFSPRFEQDLLEVQTISNSRTPEQQRIAEYWADGAGTVTPPGHWNQIAQELISEAGVQDELEIAQIYALLNMAMMDAGIACWDSKYTYWVLRPSNALPGLSLAVPLPNFPSYTSGHSAFSGAASRVLSVFFPSKSRWLEQTAEEAAVSRVYGGIHYRFDSVEGLSQGRRIGALVDKKLKQMAGEK